MMITMDSIYTQKLCYKIDVLAYTCILLHSQMIKYSKKTQKCKNAKKMQSFKINNTHFALLRSNTRCFKKFIKKFIKKLKIKSPMFLREEIFEREIFK